MADRPPLRRPNEQNTALSRFFSKLLEPTNVWWRSRYVTFLIAVGKSRNAEEAWEMALDWVERDESTYKHLHKWIVQMALRRGLLDFARTVLNDIPEKDRHSDADIQPYWNLFRAMEEDRRLGAFYPSHVSYDRRWAEPLLLWLTGRSREDIETWYAARIDDVTDQRVFLRTARRCDEIVVTGSSEVRLSDFNNWCVNLPKSGVKPRMFCEVFVVKNESIPVIAMHDVRRDTAELLAVRPDPNRYWTTLGTPKQ